MLFLVKWNLPWAADAADAALLITLHNNIRKHTFVIYHYIYLSIRLLSNVYTQKIRKMSKI